jgi:hypothetical protein
MNRAPFERLNRPTRVELTLDAAQAASLKLGVQASAVIHGSALGPRLLHGIVTRIARGEARTEVRLEPRLARLGRRKTHRIFHDRSHLEVVTQLLGEHGVPLRLRLTRSYPKEPHLIQRGESGMFYFFDHPQEASQDLDATNMGNGEILVLADSASAYSPLIGTPLHHRAAQAGATRDDQALVGLVDRRASRVERVLSLGRTFATPTKALFSDSTLDPLVPAEPPSFPRDGRRGLLIEAPVRCRRRGRAASALAGSARRRESGREDVARRGDEPAPDAGSTLRAHGGAARRHAARARGGRGAARRRRRATAGVLPQ